MPLIRRTGLVVNPVRKLIKRTRTWNCPSKTVRQKTVRRKNCPSGKISFEKTVRQKNAYPKSVRSTRCQIRPRILRHWSFSYHTQGKSYFILKLSSGLLTCLLQEKESCVHGRFAQPTFLWLVGLARSVGVVWASLKEKSFQIINVQVAELKQKKPVKDPILLSVPRSAQS